MCDYHILTAKNVGRAEQYRISKLVGCPERFLGGEHCASLRTGDIALLKQFVEQLSVLCRVNVRSGSTQNAHAQRGEVLYQLDGSLSAELNYNAVGLLSCDEGFNVLLCQWVKVQSVAGVEVGGNSFGVVIADDCLAALFLQRPYAVNGAIVELDTLTDSDRTGTEYNYFLLIGRVLLDELSRFILAVERIVEIRSACGELSRAGIYHLVYCKTALLYLLPGNTLDGAVEVAVLLRHVVLFLGQLALSQPLFELYEVIQLADEPLVYLGDVVNYVDGNAALERFEYAEGTVNVNVLQLLHDLLIGELYEILLGHGVHSKLDGADRLHHASLKAGRDSHDLSGSLHLGAESLFRVNELIERPLRELYYQIVKRRLEACVGLSGYLVYDFVESVTNRDSRSNLCDRISSSLGSQRRGTGNSRVYLDNGIIEAVGLERELAVAAALYLEFLDYVDSRGTQHLIFLIGEGHTGSNDDGVAGVYADRVEVLHGADGDDVALAVAHYLELDLLPAGDALLDQDLSDRRKTQSVGGDLVEFLGSLRDTAAGAAQSERRSYDYRVVDNLGKVHCVLDCFNDLGGNTWLTDLLHSVLERLSVLRLVNGFGIGAEQLYAVLRQESALGKFHGERKPGLAAEV